MDYLQRFAKLSVASRANRVASARTLNKAPHKPFLLLAILDLIETDRIRSNFFQLDDDLVEGFDRYWERIMVGERRGNPVMPYYHLKSDGFWHLIPKPGMEQTLEHGGKIDTYQQLRLVVDGAKLDEELYAILQTPIGRNEFRRVLVETYFAPEVRDDVAKAGKITIESFQYSLAMHNRLDDDFKTLSETAGWDSLYLPEARSAYFRREVTEAYAHTCAMCGLRIRTPEGHTAVEAAHIIPWSVHPIDHPRNGLALCRVHHWTFDEGLVTVNPHYEICLSPIVLDTNDIASAPFLSLHGQKILLPSQTLLYPFIEALGWHCKNLFRAEKPKRLF